MDIDLWIETFKLEHNKMKKQDAIRILFAELARRRLLEMQEDRQPLDEVAQALKTILDEAMK